MPRMRWVVEYGHRDFIGRGHRAKEGPFKCQFKCNDDDGEEYYRGTCDDVANFSEPEGVFEPLDTFMHSHGVTEMWYRYGDNEDWRLL